MLKRKEGWILIVESVIAIMILFGFLFTTIAKQSEQIKVVDKGEYLYNVVNELAFRAEKNETIRNFALKEKKDEVKSLLIIELSEMNVKGIILESKICNPDDEFCDIPVSEDVGDIYSSEIIIATNSTSYETKKLKIFIWE
ncbi:MAG: hypothetical protein IB618_04280 [Candidatus Pacearchaeota archaeon]|nr:MAG: hypothetical protein IB618_04280 [Candidatus Pacearchaeota archaeon]